MHSSDSSRPYENSIRSLSMDRSSDAQIPHGKREFSDGAASVRRFPILNGAMNYIGMPLGDAVKLSEDVPDCLRVWVDDSSMFY